MRKFLNRHWVPVLLVSICIAGYFPIAVQVLALKNDIIQLDLPVKYFISKELHRGQFPIWIYNWGVGFPLGHLFTWSSYNPITLFFAAFFRYNLYTLHVEFLFYILLGGMGILKIAKVLIRLSPASCLSAASVYVLSGITLSSAQFLAYIAAIGVLPWVYYSFLQLLKRSCLLHGLSFGFNLFLLFSWSYPAAFIICCYSLMLIFILWFFILKKGSFGTNTFLFTGLALFIFLLLAAPLFYTTCKTLPYFNRSQQLSPKDLDFGYLDPFATASLFFPFTHARAKYINTEPLFQTIHFGIISVGVIMAAFLIMPSRGKYTRWIRYLGISALLTLVLAYGEAFFLKKWLNAWLPGLGWFRFPSFFRLFFLLSASLITGICLERVMEWCGASAGNSKKTARLLAGVLLAGVIVGAGLFSENVIQRYGFLKKFKWHSLTSFTIIYILVLLWLICLLVFVLVKRNKMSRYLLPLLIADLIMVCVLSLPVYAVSSYSVKEVDSLLQLSRNQNNWAVTVDNTSSTFTDAKGNPFSGQNIYTNKISAANQYIGPLYLKSFQTLAASAHALQGIEAVFFSSGDADSTTAINIHNGNFKNHQFSAYITAKKETLVFLFQLWHPFWHASVNEKPVPLFKTKEGIMYVSVPQGRHLVTFEYGTPVIKILTVLHFLVLTLLLASLILLQRKKQNV
jgi:hypothetical protein